MTVRIFADSNRARMRYIKESDTAWAVTPGSGITRELRYTGSTLNAEKTTAISTEIRSDRMVPDIIETGASAKGEINVEFSAGSHDDFMEGFMYGAWTRPMTFDGAAGLPVNWTANNIISINGVDMSLYFVAGHRIRVSGFVNPTNNDYFQIVSSVYNSGAARTDITVATTVSVIEGGTIYTTVEDANDVIILKSTAIRSGTTGASTFDSNGGNAFTAAVSAGQLVPGQKIYVDGLGYESGTVTVLDPTTPALVAAGATLTVTDGINTATLQFGGSPIAGNIMVVASATDDTITAGNIAAALNALRPAAIANTLGEGVLNVVAKVASNVVTIRSLNAPGGAISKAGDTNSALTVVNYAGGNAAEHGFYTITAVVDDVITVSPAPPTNANSGSLPVTIKGSMLRNPGNSANIVPHSFSFETAFEDVGEYFVANGQRIGTMQYNISAGAILTGGFGLQGQGMSRETVTTLGNSGSYTTLGTTTTPVANATTNVGTIYKNGTALSTALKTIAFQGTNNLRDQMAVGSKFAVGIGAGRIEFTGSVDGYFSDGDLWDNFINHDTVSLNFFVQDVYKNHYEFTLPAVVFSTDTVNPAGGDQDVMENMQWTAKRDPVTQCTIQIDRFSSVYPVIG
jgi:hypothetical protein